jgi:hypothetical protein
MNLSFVLLDAERGVAMALMPDANFLKLSALLDAETLEVVSIEAQGQSFYLLVDENGLANNKPVNSMASIAAGQTIVGDAVALLADDFKALPYDMEKENDTMQ